MRLPGRTPAAATNVFRSPGVALARLEFAQLRLAGSTPPQVLRMVSFESVVLLATGIAFGSLAAAFTVLPYGIARTDSIFPSAGSSIYLGVVGSAAILALSAALLAARRALRVRPVEAVHT